MQEFKIEDYMVKPQFQTVKMFNASLESYDRQFDSKPFKFEKNNSVEVPANLVEHVYEALKDFGVFPIFSQMTAEQIKEAHREALLKYWGGKLRQIIKCYQAELDQAKRNGVTMEMTTRHKRLIRWQDEIMKMLNAQRPVEEELSFNEDLMEDFQANQNIFSQEAFAGASIETPSQREEKVKARSVRKSKTSFENIDLGDIA